jgi:Flp pilus assembly pilin Flp
MEFKRFISKFHREESGQDLLEYALVIFAVLTAVIAGSTSLESEIATSLTTIFGSINGLAL